MDFDRRWKNTPRGRWDKTWLLAMFLFLSVVSAAFSQEPRSTTRFIGSTTQSTIRADSTPSAPRNLRIVTSSSNSPYGAEVTLAWDPNPEPNIVGYKLHYDDTGGPPYDGNGASQGNSPIIIPLSADSPSFTLTGLSDTSDTYFAATAFDDAGIESDYSNEVIYTPPPDITPPIITSGPSVGSKTTTTASVNWTTDEPSNSILRYDIVSVDWSGYHFELQDGALVTGHSITITGLEPNTPYFFRTASTDIAGNGPTVSQEVTFETDPEPDSTPPLVDITTPTYSTAGISLAMGGTASDNVGVTRVDWSNSRGGSGESIGTTIWTTTPITLYTGENIITVTASDGAGNTGEDTLTVTCSYPNECPDCSGDQVSLENLIFLAGTDCTCIGTESMTIGTNVTVREGATVTIRAPEIHIQEGFHAEEGASIRMSNN